MNDIISVIHFLALLIGGVLAFFGALYVIAKVGTWIENKVSK